MLNTVEYHTKDTDLLSDTNTYETLRQYPICSYKRKVIEYLQKLEKDKARQAIMLKIVPRGSHLHILPTLLVALNTTSRTYRVLPTRSDK